jgi:hypothetical protein
MAGFGSFRFPRFAEITSSKHLTLAPRGNHAGGSILAAKMAQVLAAVDKQASKRPMWTPTLHSDGEGRRRWG